ncbi:MAG: aminotransferase class I/II-fold pyridoxal phosphate-dependent enzyme [Chloroflexota bacterium]
MNTKANRPDNNSPDAKHNGYGMGVSTLAVDANRQLNQNQAVTEPIAISYTYPFGNSTGLSELIELRQVGESIPRQEGGRHANPAVYAAEQLIAGMENAADAVLFSSGMAATTTVMLTLLPGGSHVVLSEGCCPRTLQFCTDYLARLGVEYTVVPFGDYQALEDAIRPETRLLFSESPANPYLRTLDLEKFVAVARKHKVVSFVDATFATPFNLRPADWGVDLVVHSATRYLGGHNDLLAGVVAGKSELIASIKALLGIFGAKVDPGNASLLLRGIKTLGLRVTQHNLNGQAVAEFLEAQPKVDRVWYPGLVSHPDHGTAVRQMRGFGGVVSFTVNGGLDPAAHFVDAMRLPLLAKSQGGVRSLVEQPVLLSDNGLSEQERLGHSIPENLVRLSLGIEDTDDLIADLGQALDRLPASG